MTRSGSSQSNGSAAAGGSQRASTRRLSAGPAASTTSGANGGRLKRLPRRQAKAKALEALRLSEETSSEDDDRGSVPSDDDDDSSESSDEDGGSAYEVGDDDEMHVDGDAPETRTPGGRTRRRRSPTSRTARRANRTSRVAASDAEGALIEPLVLKPARTAAGATRRSREERQQPTPPSDEDEDEDEDADEGADETAEHAEEERTVEAGAKDDEVFDLPRAAKRSGLRTLKVAEPITEVEEDEAPAEEGEIQMADADEAAEPHDGSS